MSDQITDALAAIGETAIWWREQAEAMERQRDQAFEDRAAAEAALAEATARADRLAVEVSELRAACVDRLDGPGSSWQCCVCLAWSSESREAIEHDPDCALARALAGVGEGA